VENHHVNLDAGSGRGRRRGLGHWIAPTRGLSSRGCCRLAGLFKVQNRGRNRRLFRRSTPRHQGFIDLEELAKLLRRRAQRVTAQLHILNRGMEEAGVVGEQRPAQRPPLDHTRAGESVLAQSGGGRDHDPQDRSTR